jgi:hypothetical protein
MSLILKQELSCSWMALTRDEVGAYVGRELSGKKVRSRGAERWIRSEKKYKKINKK